jgi:ABC-type Na+ efflux pump permease subunit
MFSGVLPAFTSRLKNAAQLMGIWYAVTLHMIWAVLLVLNVGATGATAVHGPAKLFPNHYGLAALLVIVAGCALLGIYMDGPSATKILLLVPQQLMLGLSAAAALNAMTDGHFADGVERSRAFIIADQSPAVLAFIPRRSCI